MKKQEEEKGDRGEKTNVSRNLQTVFYKAHRNQGEEVSVLPRVSSLQQQQQR